MKNKAIAALAALVILFSGFTGGFFLGRNTRIGTIQTTRIVYETVPGETVIVMQEVPATLPPATTPPIIAPSVPVTEPPAQTTGSAQSANTTVTESGIAFPININTATVRELDELPGIGEVIAQRIVDYRTAHGPFGSVDELINVKGIGEARLAKLKPYATV